MTRSRERFPGWVRRPGRLLACCLAGGLLLAGCGGGSGEQQGAAETTPAQPAAGSGFPEGMVGDQQPAGEPVDGGTLDIGISAETSGLDPARYPGFYGVFGGMELAAVYDVLMRYNPETGRYEPQLAKGLTHNADNTTWTLTLRPNVSFSDGTPLDAQAVQFSMNRYMEVGGNLAPLMERLGLQIRTPDPLTVVFELAQPWPNFPFILASTPGCIVSPAAVKKWGDEFASHPVGAGPFVLDHHTAGEELVLTANPDYWGGRPHLDKLRFVPIVQPQAKLETLNGGGIDAAFLLEPQLIRKALDRGYPGFTGIANVGQILNINNAEGRPGSDIQVRKAIAYAIDPAVINRRAYGGAGLPGKVLFQQTSRWHTDAKATPYDPEKARQLLNQAMQDGYDGNISLLYAQSGEDAALAIKAMLESAGFTVTLDPARTTADVIRQYVVERDYDIVIGGWGAFDPSVFATFVEELVRPKNTISYHNPQMTELLRQFRAAETEEARRQVAADIQRLWTETVPSVPLAASPRFVAWRDNVHGVKPTLNLTMLFDDAWIGRQ